MPRAAAFSSPRAVRISVLTDVVDLVVGHLLRGDHADPRTAAEPAHVGVVAVGFAQCAEVAHIAPEDNSLVLHPAAGAAGEKLADRQGRAFVAGLVEVFAGLVVDRDDLHAVDLVDAVAGSAEGGAASEPLDEGTHLVGEDVAVTHVVDRGQRLVVEHALGRPEDI